MAHFAQLDEDNKVIRVSVLANENCEDEFGFEQEEVGVNFLKKVHGENTIWKQCSYNGNLRKNFPGIGHDYDAEKDAFIPPKPYASWTLNSETCLWQAPVSRPDDGKTYIWNEDDNQWTDVSL
jgi:hypothetical protein